jgi:hypothetical protein
VVGELAPGECAGFAQALWAATAQALVVIEPGTPAGYGRIMQTRSLLVAASAHVMAPCPHERNCPLAAPDWCHFAQRLPRSRDHLRVKAAAVPFEDEKFSYVVLSHAAATPGCSRRPGSPRARSSPGCARRRASSAIPRHGATAMPIGSASHGAGATG